MPTRFQIWFFAVAVAHCGSLVHASGQLEVLKNIPGITFFAHKVLRVGNATEVVTNEEERLWSFLGIENGKLCPVFGFEEYPYFFILAQFVTAIGIMMLAAFLHWLASACTVHFKLGVYRSGTKVWARFYEVSESTCQATVQSVSTDAKTCTLVYVDYHIPGKEPTSFHAVPVEYVVPESDTFMADDKHFGMAEMGGFASFGGYGYGDSQSGVAKDMGSFVTFESGLSEEKVVRAEQARLEHKYKLISHSDGELEVESRVRAPMMRSSLRHYPATVTGSNEDGSYTLMFEGRSTPQCSVLAEHISSTPVNDDSDPYLKLLDDWQGRFAEPVSPQADYHADCMTTCVPVQGGMGPDSDNVESELRGRVLAVFSDIRKKRMDELSALSRLKKTKWTTTFSMCYWTWQFTMAAFDFIKLVCHVKIHAEEVGLRAWPAYNLFVYGFVHSGAFPTLLQGVCFYGMTDITPDAGNIYGTCSSNARLRNFVDRHHYQDVADVKSIRVTFLKMLRFCLGVLLLPLVPIVFTHILPFIVIYNVPVIACSGCCVCFSMVWNCIRTLFTSQEVSSSSKLFTLLPFICLLLVFQTVPSACTRMWAGETELRLQHYFDPLVNDYQARTWRSVVACRVEHVSQGISLLLRWT